MQMEAIARTLADLQELTNARENTYDLAIREASPIIA